MASSNGMTEGGKREVEQNHQKIKKGTGRETDEGRENVVKRE